MTELYSLLLLLENIGGNIRVPMFQGGVVSLLNKTQVFDQKKSFFHTFFSFELFTFRLTFQ